MQYIGPRVPNFHLFCSIASHFQDIAHDASIVHSCFSETATPIQVLLVGNYSTAISSDVFLFFFFFKNFHFHNFMRAVLDKWTGTSQDIMNHRKMVSMLLDFIFSRSGAFSYHCRWHYTCYMHEIDKITVDTMYMVSGKHTNCYGVRLS